MIGGGIIFGIILGVTVVSAIIADPVATIETIGSFVGTIVNVVHVIGGYV